MLEELEQYR